MDDTQEDYVEGIRLEGFLRDYTGISDYGWHDRLRTFLSYPHARHAAGSGTT